MVTLLNGQEENPPAVKPSQPRERTHMLAVSGAMAGQPVREILWGR